MGAVARRFRQCAAGGLLLLAAGCAGTDDPVVQAGTPAATTPSAPGVSSAPSLPPSAPGVPATTSGPAGTSATSADAAPAQGGCGTVTAASGLTLQVLESPGVPCADAKQLVTKFQAQLAGKQPAGSSQPASATVDGWLCVSGPPASQGGTSCSLQDKTVFAGVAAE
ncbi:hypothetical protein [Amycolatopsis sp. GM8]|uniref:hypothetical protein n=1 Tax=Amycolatopsis sp. GM8 TaxID=2896530 RepID=UPI001F16F1EE|nr:hypothetical protein [Amycolatopsis sp. GM8]